MGAAVFWNSPPGESEARLVLVGDIFPRSGRQGPRPLLVSAPATAAACASAADKQSLLLLLPLPPDAAITFAAASGSASVSALLHQATCSSRTGQTWTSTSA